MFAPEGSYQGTRMDILCCILACRTAADSLRPGLICKGGTMQESQSDGWMKAEVEMGSCMEVEAGVKKWKARHHLCFQCPSSKLRR